MVRKGMFQKEGTPYAKGARWEEHSAEQQRGKLCSLRDWEAPAPKGMLKILNCILKAKCVQAGK